MYIHSICHENRPPVWPIDLWPPPPPPPPPSVEIGRGIHLWRFNHKNSIIHLGGGTLVQVYYIHQVHQVCYRNNNKSQIGIKLLSKINGYYPGRKYSWRMERGQHDHSISTFWPCLSILARDFPLSSGPTILASDKWPSLIPIIDSFLLLHELYSSAHYQFNNNIV